MLNSLLNKMRLDKMARPIESNDENKFPNSRVGKTEFLTSIRDFKPDGVKMGIERVSKLFQVKQDPLKAQMMAEMVFMDDMDKCRLYELDDNGDYVLIKDEITGKENRKIVLEPVKESDLLMFPMFFPCGKPSEISNEAELTFYPTSSAYPLFKLALQNAGELPMDMGDKAFVTTQEELKDALEGFTFLAKCEEIKGKYNYFRLQAELI